MTVKRDPAGRRTRILAAATEEFAAAGYGGGRVDAIAARAGVNKRLLYHYFGDKSALFDAVIAQQLVHLHAFVNRAGDPAAELADPWLQTLWRLLAWDALRDSPAITASTLQPLSGELSMTPSQREVLALRSAFSVLQSLLPLPVRVLLGAGGELSSQLHSIETRLMQPLAHKPRVKLRTAPRPAALRKSSGE